MLPVNSINARLPLLITRVAALVAGGVLATSASPVFAARASGPASASRTENNTCVYKVLEGPTNHFNFTPVGLDQIPNSPMDSNRYTSYFLMDVKDDTQPCIGFNVRRIGSDKNWKATGERTSSPTLPVDQKALCDFFADKPGWAAGPVPAWFNDAMTSSFVVVLASCPSSPTPTKQEIARTFVRGLTGTR
jgi:hypothetical protein